MWLQTYINDVGSYVERVCKEFSSTLSALTAQTFLEHRNISTGDLHPSIDEMRKRVKSIHPWEDENDLTDQEFEVSRIVANVLGLSVVTSVNFPLGILLHRLDVHDIALIQAIDFYMDD